MTWDTGGNHDLRLKAWAMMCSRRGGAGKNQGREGMEGAAATQCIVIFVNIVFVWYSFVCTPPSLVVGLSEKKTCPIPVSFCCHVALPVVSRQSRRPCRAEQHHEAWHESLHDAPGGLDR